MLIEVVEVGAPYKEGKFFKMDFKYNRDGKDQGRKLVAIGDSKEAFNVLKDSKPGECYEIEVKKDGDYYNWIGASKAEKPVAAAAAGGQRQTRSGYETPEERQARQLHIARQSCIAQAVAFSNAGGVKELSVKSVLDVAQQFLDWVYQVDTPTEEDEEFPE